MKTIFTPKMVTGLLVIVCIGCENGVLAHQEKGLRDRVPRICVNKTFRRLGLNKYSLTNPELLKAVLEEDMLLGDLPSVQALMGDTLTKPKSLTPMLIRIRKSVKKKHPLIAKFLCDAIDRKLIPKVCANKHVIERMVHHTYLLEIITNEMANDWEFMVEIQNHLLAKREAFGIPSDFMGTILTLYAVTGQLFEPIKTKTMDWVFSEYQKIRERGSILNSEVKARQGGLKFNILEASIAENLNEYNDNAMAGIALAVNPPETLRVVGENKFLEYVLSQEWVGLYESWNLAFITGNLPYLHVLYPKLLIPAVIDAEPDDYIFNRALALWVSINFYLFAQLMQKPDYAVPNAEELAQLWGEINYEYAKTFEEDLSSFAYLLGTTYDMLWNQLKTLLIASGVITSEEADELSELLTNQ